MGIASDPSQFGELTSARAVREILGRFGFRPQRRYGQNFLVDPNIMAKIVAAAELRPGADWVLEVGAGIGALTLALAAGGALVTAVEIDRGLFALVQGLAAERGEGKIRVVHADALRVDWRSLWLEAGSSLRPKGVSNLPYYITAPLVLRHLSGEVPFERTVFLVQREVAERMAAEPETAAYGAFTVAVQLRADVEVLFRVPRTVFFPRPEVESAVVRLWPRPLPKEDEEAVASVTRAAFGQRRKTLHNALAGSGRWPLDRIETALSAAGIDGRRRAESLAPTDFARLARALGPPRKPSA